MSRFSFGSTAPGRWLTLVVPLLFASAAPAAHGQGRSIRPQPFLTPSTMRSTTPSTMRSITPSMTPATTTTQNNAILQRAMAFDPRLFGNFPFTGSFRPGFGSSPWWGTGSGGLSGGGVSVIPVGVAGGNMTPVDQKPSGSPADTARTALLQEQAVAERRSFLGIGVTCPSGERANVNLPMPCGVCGWGGC